MLWFEFISWICLSFNWIWFLTFLLTNSAAEWCELASAPFKSETGSCAAWVRPTEHCTEEVEVTKWVLIVRWRVRQLIYCPHSLFLLVSMPSYWLTRSKCGVTGNRLIIRTDDKRSPSDMDVQNTVIWKLLLLPSVRFNLEQFKRKFRKPHFSWCYN
jgi:hypothetical protein